MCFWKLRIGNIGVAVQIMDDQQSFIEILDSPPAAKASKLTLKDILNGNRKSKQPIDEAHAGESQKTNNSDPHGEDSIFDSELMNQFSSGNMISDENTSYSDNEILSVHNSPIKKAKLSLNDILDGNKLSKKSSEEFHYGAKGFGETVDPHNVKLSIPNKFALSLTNKFPLDNKDSFLDQGITDDKVSYATVSKKEKVSISSILTGQALPQKSKVDPRQVKISVAPELQQKIFSSFDTVNKITSPEMINKKTLNYSSRSEIIEIPESTCNNKKKLSWKEIFRPKTSSKNIDPSKIKLRLPKSFLKKIDDEESNIDPIFFTQPQSLVDDTSNASITGSNPNNNNTKMGSFRNKFFQEIYDKGKLAEKNSRSNAERQEMVKKEKLRNKNLLIMRALTREEFHVTDKNTNFSDFNSQKFSLGNKNINSQVVDCLSSINLKDLAKLTTLSNLRVHDNISPDEPIKHSIIITDLDTYESREVKQTNNNIQVHNLWADSFLPKDPYDLLVDNVNVSKIIGWLKDSFSLLEKNYQSKKRIAYIKNNLINNCKKKQENFFDSFIDDSEYFDFDEDSCGEDYSEDASEEQSRKNLLNVELLTNFDNESIPYIPFFVLYGDTGVGKTASVYCISKFLNAHVHEINTSQPHTKKALQRTLEELSTSKIVQNDRDVILFDDVDILFKGYDRAFWDLFYSVLSTSRKPIFLTCTDITMLPDKLIELAKQHNSIVELSNKSISEISKYLNQKCMDFGFNSFDYNAIENIVKYNNCNLKKCIMELQLLATVYKDNQNSLTRKDSENNQDDVVFAYSINESDTLESISKKLDMLSTADILKEQTISLFDEKNDFFKNRSIMPDEDKQQDTCYNLHLDEDYYLDSEFINLNNDSIKFVKELRNNLKSGKTLPFELNIGSYMMKKLLL